MSLEDRLYLSVGNLPENNFEIFHQNIYYSHKIMTSDVSLSIDIIFEIHLTIAFFFYLCCNLEALRKGLLQFCQSVFSMWVMRASTSLLK